MVGASWFLAGCGRGDDGQAGCGPGGESSVEVCGVDQAELLQGRCGEAGLVSLVADQDDAEVPAGDDGVPSLGGGVAAPFQAVAGDHQGAGNQAVAPLVVTADVDQEAPLACARSASSGEGRCGSMLLAWARSSSTVLADPGPVMVASGRGEL